jgi:hypothetical protein
MSDLNEQWARLLAAGKVRWMPGMLHVCGDRRPRKSRRWRLQGRRRASRLDGRSHDLGDPLPWKRSINASQSGPTPPRSAACWRWRGRRRVLRRSTAANLVAVDGLRVAASRQAEAR